jgi:hypothetical protein
MRDGVTVNYKVVHDRIIQRALSEGNSNNSDSYFELHHIIPKCLGGSDSLENLVRLTAKEHFIIHALLCKIYPNNKQLAFAFRMMLSGGANTHNKRYVSGLQYAEIKEHFSKIVAEKNKSRQWSEKSKAKLSASKTGQSLNELTKKKLHNALQGNKNGLGFVQSEDTKTKRKQTRFENYLLKQYNISLKSLEQGSLKCAE